MSIRALNESISVKHVFKLKSVQSTQIAFKSWLIKDVHKKEDLRPGILSGSESTDRSCLSIMAIALPYSAPTYLMFSSWSWVNFWVRSHDTFCWTVRRGCLSSTCILLVLGSSLMVRVKFGFIFMIWILKNI